MGTRLRTALNLAVHVQAHPSRAPLLPPLLAALGPLPATVVQDPGGDKPLAWRTYRACLERATDADYLLILQDDTVPCEDFAARVTRAVAEADGLPIALFVPTTGLRNRLRFWEAQRDGCSYCCLDWQEWVPVVALAWPTSMIAGFLEWADGKGYHAQAQRADDAIVGEWASRTRTQVLASVPCLVEHPDEVPSIVRNTSNQARNALAF